MPPILKIASFKLQVLGYEFANPDNVWDADWLNVTCSCTSHGSSVQATGPFVTVSELNQLLTTMKDLYSGALKTGEINFMEPEVSLSFAMELEGRLRFTVDLTPDFQSQAQSVTFDIDRSHLPGAIDQCTEILAAFPVRSVPDAN